MPERKEFGFTRTACACEDCTISCRHMPGYLIPADLEPMAKACGSDNPAKWAVDNLSASPGATARVRASQALVQIPTLVPRAKEDGSCIFLGDKGECLVHEHSPFGCAFFDAHMDKEEADRRSGQGLVRIHHDLHIGGPYSNIWQILSMTGHHARPPAEGKAAIAKEYDERNSDGSGN